MTRTLLPFVILLLSVPETSARGPYEWSCVRLDYARQEKVRQFKRYCDQIHETARRAGSDGVLLEFFDVNRKYFQLQREGRTAPEQLTRRIEDFRGAINEYYIRNYLCFYDILMIDIEGNVFYTVRKESNYNHNIHEGEHAGTPLARCLRALPAKRYSSISSTTRPRMSRRRFLSNRSSRTGSISDGSSCNAPSTR